MSFDKILNKIYELENAFHNEFQEVMTSDEIKNLRSKILGKGGELSKILKTFKDELPENRRYLGQKLNETVDRVEKFIDTRLEKLEHDQEVEEKKD